MKVTTVHSHMNVSRWFTIDSGWPIVEMDSVRPKKVRITEGMIGYVLIDGAWAIRNSWAIRIGGPVLRNDGTESKNSHFRHPRGSRQDGRWSPAEEFEWLNPIVELLRPVGELALTILSESDLADDF